jgi:hypothetical protein
MTSKSIDSGRVKTSSSKKFSSAGKPSRRHWLWVTRPEYYLDLDDDYRPGPAHEWAESGWWTCHRSTQKGDLAFLWRAAPRKDIGYLIEARSDAYSIANEIEAMPQGWDFGCDYGVLYKFRRPLGIADVRHDPYLSEWSAVRGSFQHRVFSISDEYWNRINHLIVRREPEYRPAIQRIESRCISRQALLEEDIENYVCENLEILRSFGHDVELYTDSRTGVSGRQYVCVGFGGRIDLLCRYRNRNAYLVIELKNVRASAAVFAQITAYMGWLKTKSRIARNAPVFGLVISRGCDPNFEMFMTTNKRVSQLNIDQLGFER